MVTDVNDVLLTIKGHDLKRVVHLLQGLKNEAKQRVVVGRDTILDYIDKIEKVCDTVKIKEE